MVLDWLKARAQKPDHPMHSVDEAKRLLADLPSDPLKALQEVTAWLGTVTTATGFRLADRVAIVKLLDDTGQPLEHQVFAPVTSSEVKQFRRMQLWKAALEYWQAAANAYAACLRELQADHKHAGLQEKDIAPLIVRALRVHGAQDRLLHMRYEAAADETGQPLHLVCVLRPAAENEAALLRRVPIRRGVWQPMFEFYLLSEALRCENQRVRAYAGDPAPTSARLELLRALMLQAASPEGMQPRQVEFAAAASARFAPSFLFVATPESGSNWYLDLEGDASMEGPAPATRRYFGAGVAISRVERLVSQLSTDPEKLDDQLDATLSPQDQIVVLKQLLTNWHEPPPLRREPRPPGKAEYAVAHGFAAACEILPRRGGVEAERSAGPKLTLESEDASAIAIERWVERDSGAWGLGFALPRKSETWIGVGTLCTLRADDGTWLIAVVRRLYREPTRQQCAGLEILAKRPQFVSLRAAGDAQTARDKWDAAGEALQGLVQAVLLEECADPSHNELLVLRGEFHPGAIYEVLSDPPAGQIRMEEALGQGEDFDRGRFTWLTGGT